MKQKTINVVVSYFLALLMVTGLLPVTGIQVKAEEDKAIAVGSSVIVDKGSAIAVGSPVTVDKGVNSDVFGQAIYFRSDNGRVICGQMSPLP